MHPHKKRVKAEEAMKETFQQHVRVTTGFEITAFVPYKCK